jgi:hypothetical protein
VKLKNDHREAGSSFERERVCEKKISIFVGGAFLSLKKSVTKYHIYEIHC